MFRLTIQWPKETQEHILLNSLSGFSKTYTERTDKNYVPVIIGVRSPGDGVYENNYVLCNKTALKEYIKELFSRE